MILRQPVLRAPRLLLRAFRPSDAGAVRVLAMDRDVADGTVELPHPYELTHAVEWIAGHQRQFECRVAATYAVTRMADGVLLGAAALTFDAAHDAAELGYWIGKPYWGAGYATEAVRTLVAWGFDEAGLNRIHAGHFPENVRSAAVLRKVGLRYEGRSRERVKKGGAYRDLDRYALLRRERSVPSAGRLR